MIRRPPRSTLFPYTTPLPISESRREGEPRFGVYLDLVYPRHPVLHRVLQDRKSTRLNSSHANISYAVFCLKKKNNNTILVLHQLIISFIHTLPTHSHHTIIHL